MSRDDIFMASGHQLEEDSIELLLLKLRSSYPQFHCLQDHQLRVNEEYSSAEHALALFARFERDIKAELSQAEPVACEFRLKQLPVLHHLNSMDLLPWIETYQHTEPRTMLYGIVHIGLNHWVPYFVLGLIGQRPQIVTIEPMPASVKESSVSRLRYFFNKIFSSSDLYDFKNIDVDLQPNGYSCGFVSYNLLDEVLSSLLSDRPIIVCEKDNLIFHKEGLKHRGDGLEFEEFMAITERLCDSVASILRSYGNITLSATATSEEDFYKTHAIAEVGVCEGNGIDARIQAQSLTDIKMSTVSEVVANYSGRIEYFSEAAFDQIIKRLWRQHTSFLKSYAQLFERERQVDVMREVYEEAYGCIASSNSNISDFCETSLLFQDVYSGPLIQSAIRELTKYPLLEIYQANKMHEWSTLFKRIVNCNHCSQKIVVELLSYLKDESILDANKVKRICIEFLISKRNDWRGSKLGRLLVGYFQISEEEALQHARRKLRVRKNMSITFSDDYYRSEVTEYDYLELVDQRIHAKYYNIDRDVRLHRESSKSTVSSAKRTPVMSSI